MKSPKILIPSASGHVPSKRGGDGFTLVEILVTVAIFAVLINLGLLIGLDDYRAYAFRQQRDTIISELRQARARAMNNIDQTSHSVTIAGMTVTFDQLSGRSSNVEIPITDGVRSIKIKINSEGRIDWENV